MSRPAAYLLKTGDFPQVTDSPELLKTVCWLKSPDQSYKRIAPKKTDEGILIYNDFKQLRPAFSRATGAKSYPKSARSIRARDEFVF